MTHPLQRWLDRQKIRPYVFARQIGIGFATLYKMLLGEHDDAKLSTLQKIEDGTDGKVSVQKQSDWFRGRK